MLKASIIQILIGRLLTFVEKHDILELVVL